MTIGEITGEEHYHKMKEKGTTSASAAHMGNSYPSRRRFSFLSDIFKLASSAGAAQIIRAILSPIITRLFLPQALGIAQNFSAIAKTMAVLSALRYEDSIQIPRKKSDAYHQLLLCILLTTFTSGAALFLVLFFRRHIASMLNAPELETLLWGVPIFMAARGYFLALQQWNAREEKYGHISSATIANSIIWNGGTAGLGLAGWTGSASMITSQIAGQAAAFSILASRFFRKNLLNGLRDFQWKKIQAGILKYKKFPLFNIWSKLLDNAALYIPTLLFSAFFSPAVAGQYSLGFNILQLPFAMLGQSIGQVLYQRASGAQHEGKITAVIEKPLSFFIRLGIYPALVFTVIAPELVTLLFGNTWGEAGIYAQILSPWMLFIFLSLALERIPAIVGKNENILIFHALNTAMRVGVLVVGGQKGSALLVVRLLGIGGSIIYLGNILSVILISGIPITRFIQSFIKEVLFCAPFLLTVYAIKNWIPIPIFYSDIFLVAAAFLIGCLYYGIAIMKEPSAKEFLSSKVQRRG